jgi:O-antigen biosynthesis protein
MPTADRRRSAAQAINYFLRQDYPNRELIILDDGSDSIADVIPRDSRIRYVRMGLRSRLGAKHDIACEMAQGEVIAHWDDDDSMASRRLS